MLLREAVGGVEEVDTVGVCGGGGKRGWEMVLVMGEEDGRWCW